MNIYSEILNLNDLCFDIGANKGSKTLEMLQFNARVVCVEPQKIPFNDLKTKLFNNSNVFLLNKALSSISGTSEIFISYANTLSTMSSEFINTTSKLRFRGITWDTKEVVETTTLDILIKEYGTPKFCKIDVEGYEVEVLKGLTSPIPFISIEFTPELKHKTFECMEYMTKVSDYVFNYSEGESLKFSFDNWLTKEDMICFLSKNNDFVSSFGDVYMKLEK
jgi:FkbM family methyltransferase